MPEIKADLDTNSPTIRIAVVDDHPMMREGIVTALSSAPDLEIVAQGASAAEAVKIAATLKPHVLVLDINMPGGGLAALQAIANRGHLIACIIVSVREDEHTVSQAMRLGAKGYVLKGTNGSDFIEIIRAIKTGALYVTPSLAARVLGQQAGMPVAPAASEVLLASL